MTSEAYLKFMNDPNPPTHLCEDELWEYYGGDFSTDLSYYAFLICRFGDADDWTTAMTMAQMWSDWDTENESFTAKMSGYDSLVHWIYYEQ